MSRARAKPARWVAALAALALLALGALVAFDRLQRAEKLRITAVEIHGIRGGRIDGEQVRQAVARALPATYFSVDLGEIESRIAALPWVFSAKLRRRWPNALVVEVAQVQPVAAWGAAHVLHSTGDLVARPADADAGAWRDLPRLSGPGDGDESRAEIWRAYQTWSKAFAAKGLHLDELHVDARGLAYLALSVSALAGRTAADGELASPPAPIRLVVPVDVANARIARFTRALRRLQRGDLAALRNVDLRYPNGFAVSRAPAAAAADAKTPTVAEAR